MSGFKETNTVIVGIGIHQFGRFEKSHIEIGREAVKMAFQDANMSIKDLDAVYCSKVYMPSSTGLAIMSTFGRTGIPITDVDAACAAGAACLRMGKLSIESGQCDIVLVLGVEKMPRGFMDPRNLYPTWMCNLGFTQNPMFWALRARRHMHEYGTTIEQIGKVSVKNHANGALNPYAMYQKPMTLDEILNSRVVNDPITLFMLCAPNEGAAALILCRKEIAHKFTKKPVRLLSCVQAVSKFPQLHGPAYCASATGNPPAHTLSSNKAYEEAGLTAADVDLAEVQDGDAFSELALYEDLGFCKKGEGGQLIDAGETEIKGRIPVNVSGGLISKGEPLGASHIGQVFELVTQIRKQAGPRQVKDAKVGLAHVYGINGNCGVTLVGA